MYWCRQYLSIDPKIIFQLVLVAGWPVIPKC